MASEPRSNHRDQSPWTGYNADYHELLGNATSRELERYTHAATGRIEPHLSLGPNKDPNFWPAACLCIALTRNSDHSQDTIDTVAAYLRSILDDRGAPCRPLLCLDQCMVAQCILANATLLSQPRFREGARHLVNYLLNTHVRTSNGTLPYRSDQPNLVLVDSLAMVCPLLAQAASAFDLPDAMELACRQLDEFIAYGLHRETGLPFHGFEIKGDDSLGLCGWGRGTGWYLLGLVETIACAPHLQSLKPAYAEAIQQCANTLADRQNKDGFYSWALTIPGAQPDTSSTSMIAYALGRAIRLQLLPAHYFKGVRQAMEAIVRVTTRDGIVTRSSAECLGLGLYPAVFAPTPWAQAYSLLLADQLAELQPVHI